MCCTSRAVGLLALSAVVGVCPLRAQGNPFSPALLEDVRARAHAVPGELPLSLRYLSAQDDSSLASGAVAGGAAIRVSEVTPVFEIRYRHGWIMVDAGMTHEMAGAENPHGHFSDERFAEIEAALRGAGLIVVTHEHPDHVGTLVRSPIVADVAPRTLLTRTQVETMVRTPKVSFIALDSAQSGRYLVVDFDRLLPIAPGVVLIRAAGHTPGSQMVYVKLASGREVVLAGDIAWRMEGIDTQRQKPDSVSQLLHEDRAAIAQQLAWLKNTVEPAGISVVVSHDGSYLAGLTSRGILTNGLDLSASSPTTR
jgi:glyoxylase-like metal-dependent hydrolase (beta-lactamase superfamily II)